MASKPVRGVIVNSDNRDIIKAGFQAGDIIIGLRGYTVDNLRALRFLRVARRSDHDDDQRGASGKNAFGIKRSSWNAGPARYV